MSEAFCRNCGKVIKAADRSCPFCGAEQAGVTLAPHAAFLDRHWAGFWRRAGAQMVDALCVIPPYIVLGVLLQVLMGPSKPTLMAVLLLGAEFLVIVFYQGALNSGETMATFGRRAVSIAMVDAESGDRIGLLRACWRALVGILLAWLILPNLIQLVTPRRRSLADYLAGTVVVETGTGSSVVVIIAVVVFFGISGVGILAAIAIPAYQDYTTRARVTGVLMTEVAAAKRAVENNAARGASDFSAGAPMASSVYLQSLNISADGAITVQLKPNAHSIALSVAPFSGSAPLVHGKTAAGPIQWRCAVASTQMDRFVPTECRI